MKVRKFILLASALSVVSISAYSNANAATATPAQTVTSASPASDITGNYTCQGYDPYAKTKFNSTVAISKNGDAYTFQWLSNGYPYNLGTGVFGSTVNNSISVVFWDPKKADYFGTEVFEIKSDGSLNAIWALQGQNKLGNENCTKVKA